MARRTFPAALLAKVVLLAAVIAAGPARGQVFDNIFGNPPPRPPGNVPNEPAPPPPFFPGRDQPPPRRADRPPAEPLPAPMGLPPSRRPGAGNIQQQELPPPPGAEQADRPPPPDGTPQDQQQPQQPAAAIAPPPREVVVAPPPQRIPNPKAVFAGLDKITGRIISFDVSIDETVQFGALQVTPRVCYSRPPTETPQTDAFVEVDEVTLKGEIKRIFTGWMFAASPGLHAVEHPIYDVWLTDCKGGKLPEVAEAPGGDDKDKKESKPAAKPEPQPRRAPRRQPQRNFLFPGLR